MILENITDVLEYEICFNVKSFILTNKRKNDYEFQEGFDIDNNVFTLGEKEPFDNIRILSNKLNDIFRSDVEQVVKDSFHIGTLFSYDGCRHSNKNNRDPVNKTQLSFSFYYDLSLNKDFNNLSNKLNSRIKHITLKFSTHISQKQFGNMFNNTGRTFYVVEIPPIIENTIKTYLNNIYTNYLEAVATIDSSSNKYDTYNELPETVKFLFEEYRIQKI